MKPIQLILICLIILIGSIYFSRVRTQLLDRLIAVVLGGLWIVTIVFPEYTSILAHLTGVGRGADLVIYLALTLSVFLLTILYSRIRKLEETLTEMAREIALSNVSKPVSFQQSE